MTNAPQEEEKTLTQVNSNTHTGERLDLERVAALATIIALPLAIVAILFGVFQREIRKRVFGLDPTPTPVVTPVLGPTPQPFTPA